MEHLCLKTQRNSNTCKRKFGKEKLQTVIENHEKLYHYGNSYLRKITAYRVLDMIECYSISLLLVCHIWSSIVMYKILRIVRDHL